MNKENLQQLITVVKRAQENGEVLNMAIASQCIGGIFGRSPEWAAVPGASVNRKGFPMMGADLGNFFQTEFFNWLGMGSEYYFDVFCLLSRPTSFYDNLPLEEITYDLVISKLEGLLQEEVGVQ